jgi:hypothetical protein
MKKNHMKKWYIAKNQEHTISVLCQFLFQKSYMLIMYYYFSDDGFFFSPKKSHMLMYYFLMDFFFFKNLTCSSCTILFIDDGK